MADQENADTLGGYRELTESERDKIIMDVLRGGNSAAMRQIVHPDAYVVRALERKAATMPKDHVVDPSIEIPHGNIVAVWDEVVFVMRPHEGVIEMDITEVQLLVDPSLLTPAQAQVLRLEVARG